MFATKLFRGLWDDLVTPKASRITFDMIQRRFGSLIEELFGLLEPAVPPRIIGGDIRPPLVRAFGYGGSFIPAVRQVTIEAGQSLTMIEADYHGVRRLMEPYKLEYKVRKKETAVSSIAGPMKYRWPHEWTWYQKLLLTSSETSLRPTDHSHLGIRLCFEAPLHAAHKAVKRLGRTNERQCRAASANHIVENRRPEGSKKTPFEKPF